MRCHLHIVVFYGTVIAASIGRALKPIKMVVKGLHYRLLALSRIDGLFSPTFQLSSIHIDRNSEGRGFGAFAKSITSRDFHRQLYRRGPGCKTVCAQMIPKGESEYTFFCSTPNYQHQRTIYRCWTSKNSCQVH
jgi:hypothetical protein